MNRAVDETTLFNGNIRIMSDVSTMALKLVLLFQNKNPLITTVQYRVVTEDAQSFLSIRIIVTSNMLPAHLV